MAAVVQRPGSLEDIDAPRAGSPCPRGWLEVNMPGSQTNEVTNTNTHVGNEKETGKEKETLLPAHAAPEDVLRVLCDENGLTQDELSKLVGADERSIRRWLKASEPVAIQQRYAIPIDDLRHLRSVLGPSLPGVQFARWLRARQELLGGERPVELIALGRYEQVLDTAEAFAAGSFN
jgi:hypothetical protein